MKTNAIVYLAALLIAAALTPLVGRLSRALGLLDNPGARKVHRQPTPRLGGIAIVVAAFAALLPVLLLNNAVGEAMRDMEKRVIAMLLASALVFIVGLADDIFDLPSQLKLLALILAAAACCAAGGRIHSLGLGTRTLELGLLSWPLTIFWIVGITVVVNFTDGLDGLASGIGAVACSAVAVVTLDAGNLLVAVTAFALAGSLSGFLIFNFNPAKIFMGDGGSLFVGFVVGSASVVAVSMDRRISNLALPAAALAVPIIDAGFTFVRRGIVQRRSLFAAERGHVHHCLLDRGLAHRQVVLVLYGVTLFSGGIATLMYYTVGHNVLLLSVLGVLLGAALLAVFRAAGNTRFRETWAAMRRNRERGRVESSGRRSFQEMQLRFAQVRTFEGWWRESCAAAESLGLNKLTLTVKNRGDSERTLIWRKSDLPAGLHDDIAQSGIRRSHDDETNEALKGGSETWSETAAPIGSSKFAAEVSIRHRRIGPPLIAQVEAVGQTLEEASHRVGLFARLMDEHSIAELAKRELFRDDDLPLAAVPPERTPAEPDAVGELLSDSADKEPSEGVFGAGLRVAVVHDFLYCYAGAERVLEQILAIVPHADVFALFDFIAPKDRGFLRNKPVRTSFIQKLPWASKKHRVYLPLMPVAIEQMDMSAYDLVISSSYVVAKGVITHPNQLHVSYCHTPVRFAWDLQHQVLAESGLKWGIKSSLARIILHYVRNWDARSSMGVDVFLTNSKFVGSRIEKFYRRSSVTLYPPVDVERFTPSDLKEDFYITASRLVPYKRIDLIVSAFNRMPNRRLIVIGDGPEMERLKAMAGPNVRLIGHQPEEKLWQYMRMARSFVFAAEEDFGIVAVEAQASGTPVIAYGRGGVTESVVPGVTGIFFNEQTPESVIAAVHEFESHNWNAAVIRKNSERFSAAHFREQLRLILEREWNLFKGRRVSNTFEPAGEFPSSTNVDLPIPAPVEAAAPSSAEPHRPNEKRGRRPGRAPRRPLVTPTEKD